MFLIGMRVRPSSTVNWTGMSRIMLMSPAGPPAVVGLKLAKLGVDTCSGATSATTSPVLAGAGAASASAAAHSAAIASCSSWLGESGLMFGSQPALLRAGQHLVDLEGVAAVGRAVMAVEDRHAVHLGLDHRLQVELDEITFLERQQLLDGGRCGAQLGDDFDLGGLDLRLQQVDPAPVGFGGIADRRRVQHVADRLQRRVGDAEVDGAAGLADFERERGRHDDLAGRRDGGELRLHLRALVLQLQRVDALPGLVVLGQDHFDDACDDALLGRREITALDAGVEFADATEQAVDDGEHQGRVTDDQPAAAQRLDRHDIEVGRDDDLAQEGAVLLHLDAADGDLGAFADEVEHPHADVAREAFVDDLHRGHAPTDDAFLARDVVFADATDLLLLLLELLALAGDALQQRIDFVLGKDLLIHGEPAVIAR
mmetsp:Transcript_48327/g.117598  ORF Transcript_48327/g.117598 Transcript_48327/m.117598 type:complete len:428 (+) Transcript_48327:250-1533(+)